MTEDKIAEETPTEDNAFNEDQYNEDEDEDFNPENIKQSDVEEDDDDDDAAVEETKDRGGGKFDYSGIESENGGLIRTRRARQLEDEQRLKHKYEGLQASGISDSVVDTWNELKEITNKRLKDRSFCGSVLAGDGDKGQESNYNEEHILIKRDYKFAGETKHEEKLVPLSSSEGQEYLKSLKFQSKPNVQSEALRRPAAKEGPVRTEEETKRLRRPLKRPPYLEQIIAGSLKPKLTTLEKSSMDWAAYVDQEGLGDELTLHNKDGYLAKQDFLNRVEMVKDSKYRELRQKQLAMQLQEQQK